MECPNHGRFEERFERLCLKIEMMERLNQERFDKQKEALVLAKQILDDRLENMNQIRGHLVDQAKDFITRNEVGLKLEALDNKFSPVLAKKFYDEGAMTVKVVVVSSVVTFMVALIVHYVFKV